MPTESRHGGLSDPDTSAYAGEQDADSRPEAEGRAADGGRTVRGIDAGRRNRRNLFIGCAVALVVILAAALALPPVHTVLKQSFTRVPQPYTALYFTTDPTIDGAVLSVPITVYGVDTGINAYGVRVWTVTASGVVDATKKATVTADKNGNWATVVTLSVAPTASTVWVSLDGTNQTLHYRIGAT